MTTRRALAVCAVVLLAGCGRLDGEPVVHAHNTVLLLEEEHAVGQTFQPASAEIRRIDFLLATYGQRVRGELEVVLSDPAAARELGRTTVSGRSIRDNRWTPARFTPAVPAPDEAVVELRWRGAGNVGVYANVMPEDGLIVNDPYPDGQAMRDGEPLAGDLAFAVQAGQPAAWLGTLRSTAGRAVWGLSQSPWFTVLWLLLLAGSAALAVAGLRRRRPQEADPPSSAATARPPRATPAAPKGPGTR